MTGSMYAAVSGLKSHMNALNVIGNNVSNVNTTAYKATRYTFNEALYTTQRSGSDGTNVSGGRNPAQVGFGASIGTIDIDMSTKNYTPTGQLLDTMIDGDGFFFVGDKELGDGATAVSISDSPALSGMNLTRLGNFNIDPNGYLVDGNGSVVWGFLEASKDVQVKTEEAQQGGQQGQNAAQTTTVITDIGDFKFDLKTGKRVEGEQTNTNNGGNGGNNTNTQTSETVKALKDMTQDEITKLQKLGANIHNVKFDTVTASNIAEVNKDRADDKKLKIGDQYFVSATMTNTAVMGAIRLPVKNEGNEVVWPQYIARKDAEYDENGNLVSPAQPAKFNDGEGDRMQADSVTIDEKSGALRVMTSDGTLYTVGYLALGKVTNPNGVTHVDGRYYQAQDGAGVIRVTTVKGAVSGPKNEDGTVDGPESAGDTKLITGGLESSGTDLATEITNMITVQRGYQANTRIVTVTDSMLEELVNMKR